MALDWFLQSEITACQRRQIANCVLKWLRKKIFWYKTGSWVMGHGSHILDVISQYYLTTPPVLLDLWWAADKRAPVSQHIWPCCDITASTWSFVNFHCNFSRWVDLSHCFKACKMIYTILLKLHMSNLHSHPSSVNSPCMLIMWILLSHWSLFDIWMRSSLWSRLIVNSF